MEALFRLMWDAFVAWYESDHGECEGHIVNQDAVVEKAEVCRRTITAKDEVRSRMEELQEETLGLRSLFQEFKSESKRIQRCSHSGRSIATWLNFFCSS